MPPSSKEKGYKFPVLPLPVTGWAGLNGWFQDSRTPGCMWNVVIIACNVAPSRSLFNCRAFVIKLKRIIVCHISETRNGKGGQQDPQPSIPSRVRVLFLPPRCISVFFLGGAATPIYEQVEFLSSVCCLRGGWLRLWRWGDFWADCFRIFDEAALRPARCAYRTKLYCWTRTPNSFGFIG